MHTWATGLPGQRRSASVSESGSGSDQRAAAGVGDYRERERSATRDPSSRVPHTNSLTPTLSHTLAAIRGPALRAARNYPTSSRKAIW
jgi:hypothetical protein